MNTAQRQTTAIHLMGHAVVAQLLDGSQPKHITIVPGPGYAGYVQYESTDAYLTSADIENRIVAHLAGPAAQELLSGTVDSGASSDMQRAVADAERLADMQDPSWRLSQPELLGQLLLRCKGRVTAFVNENKDRIRKAADALVANESMSAAQFAAL